MSDSLLERIRRLNQIFQSSQACRIDVTHLCEVLKRLLDSNVHIVDAKGHILGSATVQADAAQMYETHPSRPLNVAVDYNTSLFKVRNTKANIIEDAAAEGSFNLLTIVPIQYGGSRLGTLVFERLNSKEFTDDDLVLAEYSATVVGLEIMRIKMEEMAEEVRKRSMVEMAIGTLSYSELEAIEHVFRELNGNEGFLVASRIADRAGITRSVIVNALRKLESAGIIESRSLGMKGTYIKVLNDKLLTHLNRAQQ